MIWSAAETTWHPVAFMHRKHFYGGVTEWCFFYLKWSLAERWCWHMESTQTWLQPSFILFFTEFIWGMLPTTKVYQTNTDTEKCSLGLRLWIWNLAKDLVNVLVHRLCFRSKSGQVFTFFHWEPEPVSLCCRRWRVWPCRCGTERCKWSDFKSALIIDASNLEK